MILLSNGGTNSHRADTLSDTMVVGTVDGVALLERSAPGWTVKHRALQGCAVSAVTALDDGTLFAATHGVGVARSDDGGLTWSWSNDGLAHFDLWSARAGRLMGRNAVFVGALPAHLYVSEDAGRSWRELPALRRVSSVSQWCFPPPPRIGHVKDIVIDGDRLLVGIEIGALLVSSDFGESFTELPVEPNARECDIHRILVHRARPERIIIANGLMGVMTSDDRGATWRKNPMPREANYPDAIVVHPNDPNLIFLTVGVGWPQHWYQLGRARKDRAQPRRRHELGASARRSSQRPARGVQRVDDRGPARMVSRSMRRIPTGRCSRVSTAATPGRSSPTCRPSPRATSTARWCASAAGSPTWTTSS